MYKWSPFVTETSGHKHMVKTTCRLGQDKAAKFETKRVRLLSELCVVLSQGGGGRGAGGRETGRKGGGKCTGGGRRGGGKRDSQRGGKREK